MMQSGKDFEDKRYFNRVMYFAEATLSDSKESWPCKISDLSLKGCLLEFPSQWAGDIRTSYTITIVLSDEINITMNVSLAHIQERKAGFHCESIELDSISELRRLVELNLGDSQLLERDLSALAYSKG